LRIQMNPHFIYNALNNVQSVMILKGERESNRYIGMLSKLLRFTLEINTNEKISIKEELEYLEAYTGLQKMRMLEQIDFKITTKFSKDPIEYEIPPMLIQPVVENAIVHGLGPLKNRKGLVSIQFLEQDGFMKVTIEDNGIGIENSKKTEKKRQMTCINQWRP